MRAGADSPDPDRRHVRRVALGSLVAALVLVAAKLAAGVASGSLSLLSEAAHSGLDAAATALTLFAVTVASRPADAEHPYGHGKAENIAALVQMVALVILSVLIAREALERLQQGTHSVAADWYAFAVAGASMAVDAGRARILRRAARLHRSPALEADALNFSADVLASAGVLVGLGLVRFGYPVADAAVGLGIASYVAYSSVRLGRTSIDALMDRAPEEATARIAGAAAGVEGVDEVRRVRTRPAGAHLQTDVVIGISRSVPLEAAHHVTERVEDAIRAVEPGADVIVHVEPLVGEEGLAQTILSLAARHPEVQQVHNIFVARRPDGMHVSLHAKFPGSMPLAEAHAIAEALEAEITREIFGVARVDTHLEPLEAAAVLGADVTKRRTHLVRWATEMAERQPEVRNCHEVVVTDTEEGLAVVLHCEAAPGLAVARTHDASTRIEIEVHRAWPEVERVTVHFEPHAG